MKNLTMDEMKAMSKKDLKAHFEEKKAQAIAFEAQTRKNMKKKNLTFQERLDVLALKEADANKARRELEDKARKLNTEEEDLRSEQRYMNEMLKLASRTPKPTLDWVITYPDVSNDYAWCKDIAHQERMNLNTGSIDITITISERSDMKKYKHEVKVYGTATHYSSTSWQSNYNDRDVLDRITCTWSEDPADGRYKWMPTENFLEPQRKFSKLEDAQEFASAWQTRIEEGLAEQIERDRATFKLASKGAK
jgi:hypothetical protein